MSHNSISQTLQNKNSIVKKIGPLSWLEFPILSEHGVKHGTFLRHGGTSAPPFDSLNGGSSAGDSLEAVAENYRRMKLALGIDHLALASLVHGIDLIHAKERSPGCFGKGDGLITQLNNLGLTITHADCQAAILFDPKTRTLACIHVGWRGNVQNFYNVAVKKMELNFGCNSQDLIVCISPSLGPLRSQFIHYKEELPESFWPYQIKPLHFDLWAISRHQLEESGVVPKNIHISAICTYDNPNDYFSYRRDGARSGRHATIASL